MKDGRLWVVEWLSTDGLWTVAYDHDVHRPAVWHMRDLARESQRAIAAQLSPRKWRVIPYDRKERAR